MDFNIWMLPFGIFFIGFAIYQTIYLKKAKKTGIIEVGLPRKPYKREDDAELFQKKYKRAYLIHFYYYFYGALLIFGYIYLTYYLW
jgi:hypothetical protein